MRPWSQAEQPVSGSYTAVHDDGQPCCFGDLLGLFCSASTLIVTEMSAVLQEGLFRLEQMPVPVLNGGIAVRAPRLSHSTWGTMPVRVLRNQSDDRGALPGKGSFQTSNLPVRTRNLNPHNIYWWAKWSASRIAQRFWQPR